LRAKARPALVRLEEVAIGGILDRGEGLAGQVAPAARVVPGHGGGGRL